MDEKGFLIGITSRSKRVFSKQLWERKEVREALQDGSREWITILACICADGTALEPAIIYEGKGALHSSWVDDVEAGKHQVFLATSPSGWTNNDLGLAWLEQVFDRSTKAKTRSSYRILILDGHGSHLTMDFISYCHANKILLMVFPPHSTHSLQPLDVGMFSPLSNAYSAELSHHLFRTQGLIPVKKGDFFQLFWAAWSTSFTQENILSSFRATGVAPPNANVVLQRFKTTTLEQDKGLQVRKHGDGDTWKQLRNLFDVVAKDIPKVEAKQLSSSLHSLQVQNELLHHENKGLRTALSTKHKHKKKSKPLDLQQRKEYHGGAVFWSPRKVREARARDAVKQREAEAEKLQKTEARELKAAATLYNKKRAEEAKAERQRTTEARKREREVKAQERAAARAQKQQEKEAATAQKLSQQANKGKRTASQSATSKPQKRRRVPPPPAKTTTRGRTIKVPQKFK
ncbi:pogo transposable [Pyrenophora seminiperda CCB06]|uniref:Pogo transposable n=1 Tax=Pyrenophora seminiperda CCB06 TaxID=1302712 RepID=A0A3M7LVT2_9PLEO|nr:pogo transposable [Pyrenophora seminiperda CCB06]